MRCFVRFRSSRRLREVSRFIRKLDEQLSRELIELIKQRQDTVARRAKATDLSDEQLLDETVEL